MKPVYRPGTTRQQMIEDGWSRGFDTTQTIDEMKASGEIISKESLLHDWSVLTDEMEATFRHAHLYDGKEFAAYASDIL